MDWFWELFGIDFSEFADLSSAEQALLEIVPYVLGVSIVIGFVAFFSFGRKREEEAEKLTGLDLELSEIKRLQGKRFKRWGLF